MRVRENQDDCFGTYDKEDIGCIKHCSEAEACQKVTNGLMKPIHRSASQVKKISLSSLLLTFLLAIRILGGVFLKEYLDFFFITSFYRYGLLIIPLLMAIAMIGVFKGKSWGSLLALALSIIDILALSSSTFFIRSGPVIEFLLWDLALAYMAYSEYQGIIHPSENESNNRPAEVKHAVVFGMVVFFIYSIAQGLVGLGFVLLAKKTNPAMELRDLIMIITSDGLVLSVAIFISAYIGIALILIFLKTQEASPADYFGIKRVEPRELLKWVWATALLIIVFQGLYHILNRPPIEFFEKAYSTAGNMLIFWLAIIFVAPLFEELLFRGLLFRGLEETRLGGAGAVLVTSLLWTVIHTQYRLLELGNLFALGLLFGAARLKTRSIYPTLLMHAFVNLIALVELAWYLRPA